MRLKATPILDMARIRPDGFIETKTGDIHGVFQILGPAGVKMNMISSGHDLEFMWEHVSVTVQEKRCPVWEEMCFAKDLFWPGDQVVMQLHPTVDQYINHHPYCLHLWRPIRAVIPTPPSILVGPS